MELIRKKLESFSFDSVSLLETSLENYEIISLVFLLYDENEMIIALDTLKLFESSDLHSKNMIFKWATASYKDDKWKMKLLEALCVTQLNSIIEDQGFSYEIVKQYFSPDDIYVSFYIHPVKKILYKICEQLTYEKFRNLQTKLKERNFITVHTHFGEILFLDLIQKKLINIGYFGTDSDCKAQCQLDTLMELLQDIGLGNYCDALNFFQFHLNTQINPNPQLSEVELSFLSEIETKCQSLKSEDSIEIETDTVNCKEINEYYKIRDKDNVGICLIINQMQFKASEENLPTRYGSNEDKDILKKCFQSLGFKVIAETNVTSSNITSVISKYIDGFTAKHSVFILCVLSHGIKDFVYCSDSIPVSIEKIKEVFYTEKLEGIPKLIIIQSCQGYDQNGKFNTNGLQTERDVKTALKSDMIVYQATVPGHLAIRHEDKGSVFIQCLCRILLNTCQTRIIPDIFLIINDFIISTTKRALFQGMVQVAEYRSTFTKKLKLNLIE